MNLGITLAARLVSSPTVFLTNHPTVLIGSIRLGYRYLVTGAFELVPVFVPIPGGAFPYGADVEVP